MAEKHRSFQLRYVGVRFNGPRLPTDVLSDLPAFRELLVSYAKDHWRALNASRKRLPKGFDKSVSLDLVALREGSAMPVLDWSRDVAQEMLPEFSDELEELVDSSFQSLVSLFDGAGHERFPTALSPDHIRALNRLGSGLRDGERIEFVDSKGSDGNVVYLDTVRRKALITRVRDTYEARYEDIGTLVGLHLDGYIDVQTALHGNLRLKVDPLRVSEEFDGNIESDVQFSVTIELDNYDKYRGVVEVYDVDLIEPELSENIMRCRGRLETLRHLKAGWHAGAGEPISQMAVDVAQRFLAKRPYFAGSYRLYPMLEGGILFEFEVMGWDLSIEFWAEGNAEFYGVEVSGSREIDPMTFADIDQLVLALDQYTRN